MARHEGSLHVAVLLGALLALSLCVTVSEATETKEFFSQKLDHFNNLDGRRFQQKFYVLDDYYVEQSPPSPIFLYINGECEPLLSLPLSALSLFLSQCRHMNYLTLISCVVSPHRYPSILQHCRGAPTGAWTDEASALQRSPQQLGPRVCTGVWLFAHHP